MKYETGEYYHVFNRGAHKSDIFLDDWDYRRFLSSLNVFNTKEQVNHADRMFGLGPTWSNHGKKLVEVIEFCLMPNHYHLLLKQLEDEGISKYLQKLGTSYTQYFNSKYDHSGVIFQGKTKNRHVSTGEYFNYLVEYIYLNPVDLVEPGWKEFGIQNKEKVIKYLDSYRWTSGNDHKRYIENLD